MLAVEIAEIAPSTVFAGHAHAAWHVCFVAAGGFEERAGREATLCLAGTARVSAPGATHDLGFDADGARCILFEAHGPWWARIFARASHGDGSSRFGTVDPALADAIRGAATPRAAFAERALTVARVVASLNDPRVRDGSAARPAWLDELRQSIPAALEGRCAVAAVDRTHASRTFRAHFGLAPSEYRAACRVERAMALARRGEPLAAVAQAAGYVDQSHMTHAFRAVLGLTPGAVARNIPASRDPGLRDGIADTTDTEADR